MATIESPLELEDVPINISESTVFDQFEKYIGPINVFLSVVSADNLHNLYNLYLQCDYWYIKLCLQYYMFKMRYILACNYYNKYISDYHDPHTETSHIVSFKDKCNEKHTMTVITDIEFANEYSYRIQFGNKVMSHYSSISKIHSKIKNTYERFTYFSYKFPQIIDGKSELCKNIDEKYINLNPVIIINDINNILPRIENKIYDIECYLTKFNLCDYLGNIADAF